MKGRLLLSALALGALWWAWRPAQGAHSALALVEGLNGPEGVECFSQLRQSEGEGVEEALLQGTRHRSARVRAQCARLLGQRQDVTMVRPLEVLLTDRDKGVRTQAAKALVPLLDDEELVALLADQELTLASRAMLATTMLRDPAALANAPFLDWLLDRSHSPALRGFAYQALRESHAPNFGQRRSEKPLLPAILAARARMLKQAREDAFDDHCPLPTRAGALILYGRLQGASGYPEILPLTRSPDFRLRDLSLPALATTRNQQAVPVLCAMARATSQPLNTRATALISLRLFRDQPLALETARTLLEDDDARIRQRAAQVLSALGDKEALPLLKAAQARELDLDTEWALRDAVHSLDSRQRKR